MTSFVNELDCYKGKGNMKQLLNIIQVLCSHNIVTMKDIRYSIKNIIIAILTTLFTGVTTTLSTLFTILTTLLTLFAGPHSPFSQNWGPNQKPVIHA